MELSEYYINFDGKLCCNDIILKNVCVIGVRDLQVIYNLNYQYLGLTMLNYY